MKIRNTLTLGVLVFALSSTAYAAEIGVTGMFAQGGFDNDRYSESSDQYDYTTGRFGLLVDNPIKPYLNYRLSIGFESNEVSSPGGQDQLYGLGMTHTFAFNLFKRPNFRIWMGPQIRAVVYKGDGNRILDVSDNKGVSFGIGPEVGLSYRYNDRLNFGTSLSLISGDLTFDESVNRSITDSTYYNGGDVDGSTYGGHLSFSVTYELDSKKNIF